MITYATTIRLTQIVREAPGRRGDEHDTGGSSETGGSFDAAPDDTGVHPGTAAHQYDLVHGHGDYDLECDTGTASPRACAQRIKDFLPHRPTPTAFTRLRRRHGLG